MSDEDITVSIEQAPKIDVTVESVPVAVDVVYIAEEE